MIGNPRANELTQGTIFTCAIADEYPDKEVAGLIITARCDVSHGKATVFSYVPLVRYEDWLLRDGLQIIAGRSAAMEKASIKTAVTDAKLSASIIGIVPYVEILAEIKKDISKTGLGIAKRFENAMSKMAAVEYVLKNPADDLESKRFLSDYQKIHNQVSSELLSNGLAEYYYLEKIETQSKGNGYVALLREIRSIPSRLVVSLLTGIDYSDYDALCKNHPQMSDRLKISKDGYAMPIGIVTSPFIEHFMQRLTFLFSRIGVTDVPVERLKSIQSLVPFDLEVKP